MISNKSCSVWGGTECSWEGECRRHPDWFRENASTLKLSFERRNHAYTRWLSSKKGSDREKFVKARNEARWATRAAKDKWYEAEATETQEEDVGVG